MWKPNAEGEDVLVDPGVEDKRLCVLESEFSTALKQFSRQGNVLSAVIRDCWDCKPVLRTLTKNSPLRATGAHISIIAHTTPEDLHAHLNDTDTANGLGNRFVVILTHRERKLPNPGRAPADNVSALAAQVEASLEFARGEGDSPQCRGRAALERSLREADRGPAGTHGDAPGPFGEPRSEAFCALRALCAVQDN